MKASDAIRQLISKSQWSQNRMGMALGVTPQTFSTAMRRHDMKAGTTVKVAEAEFWSFQRYNLAFSDDGNWLAFDAMHMFDPDIFLYNLKDGSLRNFTRSASMEQSPVFTPDGKYMYLLANLTATSFPRGARPALYKLPLRKYDTPFKSENVESLFRDKKDEPKKDSTVVIDFKDIHERMTRVEREGFQGSPYIFSVKGKDYLLYRSMGAGTPGVFSLEISDPDAKPKQVKAVLPVLGRHLQSRPGRRVRDQDRSQERRGGGAGRRIPADVL